MSNERTRIERRRDLPPLVPECEWNVPDPTRSGVPDYVSYEVVRDICDDCGCTVVDGECCCFEDKQELVA